MGISRSSLKSNKFRPVIGIDSERTYFDNATLTRLTDKNLSQEELSQFLHPHLLPHRDDCHFIALETNGTIFNHHILKQANRKIFADRISSYLISKLKQEDIENCQKCDCMPSKDKMFAILECSRCLDREASVPPDDSVPHGQIQQKWNKEDDDKPADTAEAEETDWKEDRDDFL